MLNGERLILGYGIEIAGEEDDLVPRPLIPIHVNRADIASHLLDYPNMAVITDTRHIDSNALSVANIFLLHGRLLTAMVVPAASSKTLFALPQCDPPGRTAHAKTRPLCHTRTRPVAHGGRCLDLFASQSEIQGSASAVLIKVFQQQRDKLRP